MPYRRSLQMRPVNSLKHVVDVATSAVLAVTSTIPVIDTVDAPTSAQPERITTGSTVSSIYLRVETLATGTFATVPRVYMTVQKTPGNSIGIVFPASVGISDDRKWVIHQEMQMVGGTTDIQIPRTMFQGVIKIPSKMRRFGVDDRLAVSFSHDPGETSGITNVCIQCIYKEFR